jgi:hypothetical protein
MPPPAPPPHGRLRSFCCPRMRRGTWCREVVDCLAVWGLCPSCLRNFRWMCGLAFSPFFRGVVPLPESALKILFGVVPRQFSGSTSRLRIGPQQRVGSGPLLGGLPPQGACLMSFLWGVFHPIASSKWSLGIRSPLIGVRGEPPSSNERSAALPRVERHLIGRKEWIESPSAFNRDFD